MPASPERTCALGACPRTRDRRATLTARCPAGVSKKLTKRRVFSRARISRSGRSRCRVGGIMVASSSKYHLGSFASCRALKIDSACNGAVTAAARFRFAIGCGTVDRVYLYTGEESDRRVTLQSIRVVSFIRFA